MKVIKELLKIYLLELKNAFTQAYSSLNLLHI